MNKTVAIIGAGAGGLPAAVALAEKGVNVKIIERGDYLYKDDIRTNKFDYELGTPPWIKHSTEWQGPFELQRGIGLGGSTLYFQGVSHMPPDSVIERWGLPTAEITKLKNEVVNFLQIAGEVQPAHKLNTISSRMLDSAKQLSWKVRHAPVAILSRPHDERPACNYCGLCVFGCRPGDKSSAEKTWLPRALKTGRVEILSNAKVNSLILADKTTVKHISITQQTKTFELPVNAVVVSAGALETPYLLRHSNQALAPDGIGNKNVGRYLTGSIWQSLLLSVDEESARGYAGIPIDILVEEFTEKGILLSQGRNQAGITGPISAARMLMREGYQGDVRAWMRKNYSRLVGIGGYAESSTSFEDGIGGTKAKTFVKSLNDSDTEMIKKIRKALVQWSTATKAKIILPLGNVKYPVVGAMLRGTCRLGADPETSAVNSSGQLRGYDNIYISDASIIGRGLIANPSLMLQVLGLYVGRKCADRLMNA
ncbi:MAG TPA: GMC family oxidoreductase [Gammaproteobacteria bacterium]|nr:GMC family oxidoreductase [Gammaproteobacteria bacterium]